MALLALASLALLLARPAAAARALRVMPLGDSITQWHCDAGSQGGWRHYLFDAAQAAGAHLDAVSHAMSHAICRLSATGRIA